MTEKEEEKQMDTMLTFFSCQVFLYLLATWRCSMLSTEAFITFFSSPLLSLSFLYCWGCAYLLEYVCPRGPLSPLFLTALLCVCFPSAASPNLSAASLCPRLAVACPLDARRLTLITVVDGSGQGCNRPQVCVAVIGRRYVDMTRSFATPLRSR